MTARRRLPARLGTAVLLFVGLLAGLPGTSGAGPRDAPVLVVLGASGDGRRWEAACDGARIACRAAGGDARVEAVDTSLAGGWKAAVRRARKAKPCGVLLVPATSDPDACWKAARDLKVPCFLLDGAGPDAERNRGNVFHLGPSPAYEAILAADGMRAPLAARRVVIVHEATPHGVALAEGFGRNLTRHVTLAGVVSWAEDEDPFATASSLGTWEADWVYVALTGRRVVDFVEALQKVGTPRQCLFADGNRSASLVARAPEVLEGSVFLDGPDPELHGRDGEDLVAALDEAGLPIDVQAVRAYEAGRRLLRARASAGGGSAKKLLGALRNALPDPGVFGTLAFEEHGGLRLFPAAWWRVRKGELEIWEDGTHLTPGCGPPLGFGKPAPAEVNAKKGRLGYLTFSEGAKRTIEQDLLAIGLSTGGEDPELDAKVRAELLARAIRIAHQLFRREADGTPIPGWSWGMTFTTAPPPDDMPSSRVWTAVVAGDDPAAGGRVTGSNSVAVYSTFLQRTMYVQHRLDPALGAADRIFFEGSHRWGLDRTADLRAETIRCLVDGYASAMGLTTSHEFGHLCGCGHDTEHPTSIMNVVAGAGASWEAAVWIPSHQKNVSTSLGIE